jgi:endonuclease/exonuclease/phosphatase family metal-dependent hydrolase
MANDRTVKMKNNSLFRSTISGWVLAFLVLSMAGCAKDQEIVNQKPVLAVTHVDDGLQVTLNGRATDPDGTISGVTIDWGDNKHEQLPGTGVADFTVSHLYAEPATCQIIITALDDAGETTALAVPVTPAFKETSLAGVKPGMFRASENEFLVLTLNLHTYQEARQNEKLNMITDVIGKMKVDFICFQECAQNKYSAITGGIIREDNMALIISQRIMEKYQANYHFAWNWSHYGWEVWEEGVAVLSRFPIIHSEDRYVSTTTGTGSITSRKVIYASCQAPGGLFNIFSAHTHWRTSLTDEEQNRQINNIKSMVSEKEAITPDAFSIVCGDFNGNPPVTIPGVRAITR